MHWQRSHEYATLSDACCKKECKDDKDKTMDGVQVMMLALSWAGASALEGVRCCKWRWGDSHDQGDGNAVDASCLVLAYSLALSRSLHLSYMQLQFTERFEV